MERPRTPLRLIVGTVAALAAAPVLTAAVLASAGGIAWPWVLVIGGVTGAALIPLVIGHQRGLTRIADYADAAARGAPRAKPVGTLADVAAAIGRLARAAADQQRRADLGAQANAVIIENLPNPLLLVGGEGLVVGANLAARAAFGAKAVGQDLTAVLRVPALLDAAADVMGGALKREVEFEQPVPVSRTFSAIVERLPSDDGEPANGIAAERPRPVLMMLFHDQTAIKRTEQMRAGFVANVSHELRTPLSSLVGFVETLSTSARNDPVARERFLGLMAEQGQRMTRLIDDLLSLSRIELDEHTRPSELVDLGARAQNVIQALVDRAASRGITLDLVQPDPDCLIVGESDQVHEVVENLVENAIRYSAAGGTVTVRVWRAVERAGDGSTGTIGLAVKDQGEGIPREHLPRITERFYRVDKARSRAMGGTGLGLAIVKHIVSRHRAALQIESKVGAGSTFTVYWPAAQRAAASNAAAPRAAPRAAE